jgi:hemerythrin
MALIEWSPRLQLDVPDMDRDHHRIVDLMVQLERQSTAGEPRARLDTTFRALGETTRTHFADEERFMQSIAYPEFAAHKVIHTTLLEKFATHYEAFRTGSAAKVDSAVFEFLTFWLRSHISGIDRRYADHVHNGRGTHAK